MNHTTKIALVCTLVAAQGCYVITPTAKVSNFGAMDPARDKAMSEQADDLESTPPITVLAGTAPEGLELVDNGSKLVVLEGYEDRYRVIGMAEGDYMPKAQKAVINNIYGTWTYEDTPWRKGYCYWQVPLKVATLGLWAYLPPHYPCIGSAPRDEDERQIALIEEMKKSTHVMGGNTLLVVGGTTLTTLSINTQSGATSTSVAPYVAMHGFVVEDKQAVAQ
ncbi:MAG: hypothetical protein ACI8PZ_005011 [Myxococcota bacterium]|jgi:hypothetical protein